MASPPELPSPAQAAAGGGGLQRAPRRGVRLAQVTGALLLVLLALLVAVPAGLYTALRSESGSAWLVGQVPGLTVTAPRGGLLGGDFAAERIALQLPGAGDLLVLDQVAWAGMTLARSPDPGTWLAVKLQRLSAQGATLTLGARPADAPAAAAPAQLRLPVSLLIEALAVDEFRSPAIGAQPLRGIGARLQLGADGGARHRIDGLSLQWDRLAASGSLQIGADAPLPLQAELRLQAAAGAASAPASAAAALDDWRAKLVITGPLETPTLRADARRGDAAALPLLEATAGLRPFAAWPLAELTLRSHGLDLAAFASAAPRTAFEGEATVRASGLGKAASADIRLENSAAGPWNEGRLPVRSLQLQLSGRPDQPQVARIERFEALLGATARPAGRISGRGGIDHARWTVDATLDGVMPRQLDARAAAMRLSGTLALKGQPGEVGGAPPAPAASAASAGSSASGVLQLTARAALTGRLESAPEPTRSGSRAARPATGPTRASPDIALSVDASARVGPGAALQLELKQAEAGTGTARAQLSGQAERSAETAPWQLRGTAALTEFDPRPWWTGAADSPWQRGPHRLNAEATLDLRWDASATTRPASTPASGPDPLATVLALLAPVRGEASLQLRPSVLAGVPLEGRAQWTARGAAQAPLEADAALALTANGNRLDAKLSTRADRPAADRWTLQVEAPALGALAPAAALLGLGPALGPSLGATAPTGSRTAGGPSRSTASLAGRLSGQASGSGRWPALRTEGRLSAEGLRAGSLAVQRGDLRWQLGTEADAPAELQASLTGLSVGGMAADSAKLRLDGTARAHRLVMTVDSRALPPAWLAGAPAALGTATTTPSSAPPPAGSAAPKLPAAPGTPSASEPSTPSSVPSPTRAELRADGGLLFPGGSALAATGWRGLVQALDVRSGSSEAASLGLRSNDLALELGWADGQPARLAVQPGRLELQTGPTVAALRWSRLAWQAAGPAGSARIDAEAELEPMAVAPVLARLQSDFGWAGDLQIGGKLLLQSAPALKADIVIERRRGDLSVTDETGTQALGLSDLRLALTADKGVWSLTHALAGSTVGVAAGAVVARTGSASAWPTAATPIQGVMELRVANLGAWGPWVPAGWRLGGALRTSASIGGRLGAPEYTGELRGNGLSVRNFAEGVNVTDGEVAVALQGSTARIETFSAKAGSGSLGITGGASFGSAPQAELRLRADRFQLLGRVDRRIVASGEAQLRLGADKLALDGQFGIDEGLIDFTRSDAPSLSDDVVIVRPPKGSGPPGAAAQQVAEQRAGAAASRVGSEAAAARRAGVGPAAPKPAPNRVAAINLGVKLGERLRLRGRGLDSGLRGELRITSPGGRLAVNGTVSTQDGTYQAYGQKLTIDRGSIAFSGLVDNPRLDIEATRPNTDVRVGVTVTGTAANPRVRLFSDSDLSEVDKLSWLVLGRATDGLGRADTALLQRAALALLSGEGPGVTDKLTKAIGLDEVSLRQTDGEVRETVISLGKQLSRRWYVGYERGLNATTGSWQLIYRIAQRLTLRAQSGLENSLDVIWTWRWQ